MVASSLFCPDLGRGRALHQHLWGRMPPDAVGIIGGFDCHTDMHVAAALDPLGRLLGTASFAATPHGYDRAPAWLRAFGPIIGVAVESTGSFGAALARSFAEHGLRIIEVNQPHRYVKARRGKTDSIDAEAAVEEHPNSRTHFTTGLFGAPSATDSRRGASDGEIGEDARDDRPGDGRSVGVGPADRVAVGRG